MSGSVDHPVAMPVGENSAAVTSPGSSASAASPASTGSPASILKPSIAVCVCTYKRNGPLRALLQSVIAAAEHCGERAQVGVVLADDNPDGAARVVADEFADQFELGVRYVQVGKGNISLVRNAALDVAVEFADFYASTDDDCIVPEAWLSAYLEVLERHGDVHAVTSRLINQYPSGSPSWLADEPFNGMAAFTASDGDRVELGATNNSMIRVAFLRANPSLRFREELGVVGGEDMVFFTEANRLGLTIQFVERSTVTGMEPASRATLGYQLRSALWLGNTMAVTTLTAGSASRRRVALRGAKRLVRGVGRTPLRIVRRSSPQVRYSIAEVLQGIGQLMGGIGVRVRHH